ncbi:hypothetical protein [Kitasatospora sp. NBC_01266]|uniref:hypothetical protein n=1 Tax=Kitasatospora sp. NBC_01266 TaxID=2903572 RepID=UPI002E2F479D|nr:hypothetical protein [Kitasatospora sp. NBC_01266]
MTTPTSTTGILRNPLAQAAATGADTLPEYGIPDEEAGHLNTTAGPHQLLARLGHPTGEGTTE